MTAPIPDDEARRLAILRESEILDTEPEEAYDDIVRLAAYICDAPIAAVTLVDSDRQWFKAILGIDVRETPREISFCAHTILGRDVMVVDDATKDSRFADNVLVTGDPHIRFYGGAPLITSEGVALGALCVVDSVPRSLTEAQKHALEMLARQVSTQIASRSHISVQRRLIAEREAAHREVQRLASIVEDSGDAIYSKNLDGIITTWNKGAEALYGFNAADMIGRPVRSLIPDDRLGELERIMDSLRAGSSVDPLQTVRNTKDGSQVDVDLRVSSIVDYSGAVVGASVIARDDTARKEAELQISRLAAIVDSSEDAILGGALDGTLLIWNAAAERLYGYSAQEMIGRNAAELARQGEISPVPAVINSLKRGETVDPLLVTRTHKSGIEKEVLLSFSPIRDRSGDLIGLACISRDVTAEKRAETALLESEARFRGLSAAAFEGIAISQNGVIVDANPAYAALFGYESAGEMAGIGAAELIAPDSLELVRRNVREGYELPYEANLRRRDGTLFVGEIRGRSTIFNGARARVTAIRDLTERKLAEQQILDYSVVLEFQKAELEKANAELAILATTDGLTGLQNRRAFDNRLKSEFERGLRYRSPMSLILLDVDRFKAYNDSFGHQEGDEALRRLAHILMAETRTVDFVARYGGEEIAVILPETDIDAALLLAERLRVAIEGARWDKRPVTASLGVSSFQLGQMRAEEMLETADRALYASKSAGRNRVTFESVEENRVMPIAELVD